MARLSDEIRSAASTLEAIWHGIVELEGGGRTDYERALETERAGLHHLIARLVRDARGEPDAHALRVAAALPEVATLLSPAPVVHLDCQDEDCLTCAEHDRADEIETEELEALAKSAGGAE